MGPTWVVEVSIKSEEVKEAKEVELVEEAKV